MRLWSLHPKYLDTAGLVALWREALLAKHVLAGKTRGYKHHPQLERFRNLQKPSAAIRAYLSEIQKEAARRGYAFNKTKCGRVPKRAEKIPVPLGQARFEFGWLLRKTEKRSLKTYEALKGLDVKNFTPEPHPSMVWTPGGIAPWEKGGRRKK